MNVSQNKLIACRTVIEEMKPLVPPNTECITLDSGLHVNPEKLRAALREIINEITADTENIILGYGLCSMGVIGLSASRSNLVVPRLDDCIAIFLGSRKAYENELDKEPGTYFLSKGWVEAGITLLDDLKRMEKEYGKDRADRIMKRMLKNYRRLAYVDMGNGDQDQYRKFSRRAAEKLNLDYQQIRGTKDFMEKILKGPWDDDFIVAPPGYTISMDDFKIFQGKEKSLRGLQKESVVRNE
ncbi:DUF1638 domain-containing protein [Thermodesulfobacteriota bacterium]